MSGGGNLFWAAAEGGGKTYHVNLGGGENVLQSVLSKPLLEASEIGFGLVGASFF